MIYFEYFLQETMVIMLAATGVELLPPNDLDQPTLPRLSHLCIIFI